MIFSSILAQWFASTALTIASVTIALVAVVFTYRQNAGWKPVVLVTSHGLRMQDGEYGATINFEFWNRRKYPIVIRHIDMFFRDLRFIEHSEIYPLPDNWHDGNIGRFSTHHPIRLEPHSHREFDFSLHFKKQSLDAIDDKVSIEISFFDPMLNRYRHSKTRYRYNFRSGRQGWKYRLRRMMGSAPN